MKVECNIRTAKSQLGRNFDLLRNNIFNQQNFFYISYNCIDLCFMCQISKHKNLHLFTILQIFILLTQNFILSNAECKLKIAAFTLFLKQKIYYTHKNAQGKILKLPALVTSSASEFHVFYSIINILARLQVVVTSALF